MAFPSKCRTCGAPHDDYFQRAVCPHDVIDASRN